MDFHFDKILLSGLGAILFAFAMMGLARLMKGMGFEKTLDEMVASSKPPPNAKKVLIVLMALLLGASVVAIVIIRPSTH